MARKRLIALGLIVVTGFATTAFMLRPVNGPVRQLDLASADPAHGEYLIRLGGCVACHTDTRNDGAFLAGGAPIESPFGTFVGPNITSDPVHGIGGWTLEQFATAMSEGITPDGSHYYPAFPYANYTLMSDADIADLYAALQAVPPVAASAEDHQIGFPFNMRFGLAAWKNLFFAPARFEPDPDRSGLWNRGAYIVSGPGHCGACHTPRNIIGGQTAAPLSGGDAPAITADTLLALGYDREWLEEVLEGGVTPSFDIPGGTMAEVISESTTHWTGDDILAAATYLLDIESETQ